MKTMVVADIHGYDKLLEKAIAYYKTLTDTKLVFVGDYIDRGPNPLKCLELVHEMVVNDPENVIALMGNHEELLLEFVENGNFHPDNGILKTLESFTSKETVNKYFEGQESRLTLIDAQWDLLAWVRQLPKYYESRDIIVAHAGIHMKDRENTNPDFLLWAREQYMVVPNTTGKPIVTGHTPTSGINYLLKNTKFNYKYIGSIVETEDRKYFIDGGVFIEETLNAVVFEDGNLMTVKNFTLD